MLIIYRGQRSVLYSPESSPADCSSLGYSVTNDIFRWHSLSCKHLWGWWSQENELRKAKNRPRAVTRHEDLPFPLWEGWIKFLYRSITPCCAVGLELYKGESWNVHLSMDCQALLVNEANWPPWVTVGGSYQQCYAHQSKSQWLQQCHYLSLKPLCSGEGLGPSFQWFPCLISLSFGISQGHAGPGMGQHLQI